MVTQSFRKLTFTLIKYLIAIVVTYYVLYVTIQFILKSVFRCIGYDVDS